MYLTVLITSVLIALARITDITLDTVRTVAIVQGRRKFAAALGFLEAFIYIVAVAQVLRTTGQWWYIIAYAAGFAGGTYLGITIEQLLAFGEQLVTVFTRRPEILCALRNEGFRVTEFVGRGRDGQVQALFIEVPRRSAKLLTRRARELDPNCFYIVNDVRTSSAATITPGGSESV